MYILLLILCLNFYSNLEFRLCQNVVRVCRRHFIQALEKDINSGIRGCIYIQSVRGKKGRFRSFKFGALPTLLPFNLRSDAVWITFRNIVVMETHEKIKVILLLSIIVFVILLSADRGLSVCTKNRL